MQHLLGVLDGWSVQANERLLQELERRKASVRKKRKKKVELARLEALEETCRRWWSSAA